MFDVGISINKWEPISSVDPFFQGDKINFDIVASPENVPIDIFQKVVFCLAFFSDVVNSQSLS